MRVLPLLGLFCLIAAGCSVILAGSDRPKLELSAHVSVYYGFPGKNQYNSAEKYYKKETRSGHFAQTKLELENEQKLAIMAKANALHFFQMPDSFYHYNESSGSKFQWLRIAIDSLDKTVNWHGSIDSLQPKNFNLRELMLFVDSIVKSTDEYKGLPKSELSDD